MTKKTSRVAVAVAMAMGAPLAFSQQESAQLEEVVVTAQKREESAQKAAISMTVYSSEEIVTAGIHDIASLATADPSMNLTVSNGAGYVAVRGIASTDVTEIGDPAVAISRDGFFTNRSYGLYSSMYDIERIEVLKGPQGTLFGRNSTGGAINIITRKPDREVGGYAAVDLGSFSARNFEAALNAPLGDRVQLRVSGISRRHDGYRDNAPQRDGDDEHSDSVRIQLAFQPFEDFTGWISAQRDRTRGVGDVSLGTRPINTFPVNFDSRRFAMQAETFTNLDSTRLRWELNYAGLPGGATVTYLGGREKMSWDHALDGTGGGPVVQQFLQSEHPTTINHELRVSAAPGGRVFWQAGVFYFKETNDPLDSGLFINSGQFANQYLIKFNYAVETISKAGFGQLAVNVSDALKLSGGLRYTKDSKRRTGLAQLDLTVASGGFLAIPFNGCYFGPNPSSCSHLVVPTPGNGILDDSKVTYHLGADWTMSDINLLYAKFDTGYKSGGFNSNGSAPSVAYGPESVKAFELGTKNRFLDNRAQLNAAVFYQKYTGYQASQFVSALGGGPGIQNAGEATIKGAEVEFITLGSLGRLNLQASLLDTRFSNFLAVDATGTSTVDLSGNDLPNAPGFSLSAGFEHAFPLASGALTARIDGKYTGAFYYSFFNFADTRSPSRTVGNASLTYAPESSKWNLQAYVRNFTDEVVFSNIRRNTISNSQELQFAPPRTFGARLQYNW